MSDNYPPIGWGFYIQATMTKLLFFHFALSLFVPIVHIILLLILFQDYNDSADIYHPVSTRPSQVLLSIIYYCLDGRSCPSNPDIPLSSDDI